MATPPWLKNAYPEELIQELEWTWWSKGQSDSQSSLTLFQDAHDGTAKTNMTMPGRLYDAHAFALQEIHFTVTNPQQKPLPTTDQWTHFDLSIGDKRYYSNAFQLMKHEKRLFPWGEELLAFTMRFEGIIWMPRGIAFKVNVDHVPLGMTVGCALNGKLYRPLV